MEEAAGIPLTFGLAVRGLIGCCNIKNSQSILIHSRDSTGLAAVQVKIAVRRAWEREYFLKYCCLGVQSNRSKGDRHSSHTTTQRGFGKNRRSKRKRRDKSNIAIELERLHRHCASYYEVHWCWYPLLLIFIRSLSSSLLLSPFFFFYFCIFSFLIVMRCGF